MASEKSQKTVPAFTSKQDKTVGQASVPAISQAPVPALSDEAIHIYRRRLPHWRRAKAVYFVTWRLHPLKPELTPSERSIVAATIKHFHGQRYELFAYVIMNDHVHVLIQPADEHPLETIVHSWKSFTAHQLHRQFRRQGTVWQDEYFDRIVRDEAEFFEKAQYILNNPRSRWPELEEYPWVEYFDEVITE